jgi:hypothetical protein
MLNYNNCDAQNRHTCDKRVASLLFRDGKTARKREVWKSLYGPDEDFPPIYIGPEVLV